MTEEVAVPIVERHDAHLFGMETPPTSKVAEEDAEVQKQLTGRKSQ
jgi:hypothetical protein